MSNKQLIILVFIPVLLLSACVPPNETQQVIVVEATAVVEDNNGQMPDAATGAETTTAFSAADALPAAGSDNVPDPNPPLTLPFTDTFDAGLDDGWRVLSGNPVIANGKLGAAPGKEVYLEIGNNDLRDYTVAVDITGGDYAWNGHLYLTLTPSLQAHLSSDAYNTRIQWLAFADNKWEEINNVRFDAADAGNFKIAVSGNNYAVYANGRLASELVYGSPRETGSPLVVQVYGRAIWLDDFSIR